MLNGQLVVVPTREDLVFIEALAPAAASALYKIPAQQSVHNSRLKGISIVSTAQFSAEVNLWRSFNGQPATDPQKDTWIGAWQFSENSFEQVGANVLWRAIIYGLDIPYQDFPYGAGPGDVPCFIYAILVNRSAAKSKQAYPTDSIVVSFHFEPVGALTV